MTGKVKVPAIMPRGGGNRAAATDQRSAVAPVRRQTSAKRILQPPRAFEVVQVGVVFQHVRVVPLERFGAVQVPGLLQAPVRVVAQAQGEPQPVADGGQVVGRSGPAFAAGGAAHVVDAAAGRAAFVVGDLLPALVLVHGGWGLAGGLILPG